MHVLGSLPLPAVLLALSLPLSVHAAPQQRDPDSADLHKRFELYTTLTTPQATGSATGSASQPAATYVSQLTGLVAPDPPGNLPKTVNWNVWESADARTDPARGNKAISVPQPGNFLGFSIEMSVTNQVLGPYSYELRSPFLNYLQNLRVRTGGGARVRVGGNSQEGAQMFEDGGLPARADGKMTSSFLQKEDETTAINPTNTPNVLYTKDLIEAMKQVSKLVDTQWMYGIAFLNNTVEDWKNPFEVALYVENQLAGNLLGLQIANEPDLYQDRRRGPSYQIPDWTSELQSFFGALKTADPDLPTSNNFHIPNVCCNWSPDQMMESGMLDTFKDDMKALTWQHYPHDNCGDNSGTGQAVLAEYHSHQLAISTAATLNYNAVNNVGIAAGLEVVMAETNTASCSGFLGVSDAFISALWNIDWTLTQAAINFTSSYMHVGGRDAHYNPFTAIQTNQSSIRGWTTGPSYYTALVIAETFGSKNIAQVVDISPTFDNNVESDEKTIGNNFPAYAIYEDNVPTKLAFLNYANAPGTADYSAVIQVGGITEGSAKTTPTEVYVRYLNANATTEMFDITWAGQTASPNGAHSSDGTLTGAVNTVTVPCDVAAGTCTVNIPAPGFALVFLTKDALAASSGTHVARDPATDPNSTVTATTFPTTYNAQGQGSATAPEGALETGNGRGGVGTTVGGSTSKGETSSAATGVEAGSMRVWTAWGALAVGTVWALTFA